MKTEKRDPANVFIGWVLAICLFVQLVVCAVAWPLVYCWILGSIACLAIPTAALLAVSQMGVFGYLFIGNDLIKNSFELVGLILRGLVELSAAGK